MRSIFRTASSAVALSTLGLLVVLSTSITTAQITDSIVNSRKDKFKDSLNSLNTLTVGPYPRPRTRVQAEVTSGFSPNPAAMGLITNLDKRYTCDPGYGICGNGCCLLNENCFSKYSRCCAAQYEWMCGGIYCCPYNSCLTSGHCGCNDNLYRCGDYCCKNGCSVSGDCACDPSYPVDCGISNGYHHCCPSGTICINGGAQCQTVTGGGGGGGTPIPPPSLNPSPAPSINGSGGGGAAAAGGVTVPNTTTTAAGSNATSGPLPISSGIMERDAVSGFFAATALAVAAVALIAV